MKRKLAANRVNLHVTAAIAAVVGTLSIPAPASAVTINDLFVFGDSYSDTGAFFPLTNGSTAVGYLANNFNITLTTSKNPDPGTEGGGFGPTKMRAPLSAKLCLVAHRLAMAGNDDRLVRYRGNIRLSRLDHPVDIPAGRVVDEGIDAIPIGIPAMKNIGFWEGDGDVAVRMRGPIVLQGKLGTVQVDRHG